ncbi:autophagy-related protein 16-1 isoform X2 [Amphiprion ocellaris]|uniref:autophagy-related protein 16-1 isoform X2 n=1 Tax=Amphiprion ocellaris TaxID=80972 RepID=UPI00241150F9|nr:autophagy-related protein 16-1 isoform X2 [Amphiprion ocellaris]
MFITMGSWKTHVRAGLQQRDFKEKLPFAGVFTSLSHLEERFEIRKQIVDDVRSNSSEPGGTEVGKSTRFLQLQLRESEHLAEKLSQTVSDLTTVLHLKEAELQHWQSRVSKYRQEALTLAKGSNALKAALSEFEFTVECQSKELAALRVEQKGLKETLAQACIEKERLLQRWMEEKREEAERLNKYNDMQERWEHLADQLKKHFQRRMKRECSPIVTRCSSDATENSPSAIKGINTAADKHQGHSGYNHVSAAAKV